MSALAPHFRGRLSDVSIVAAPASPRADDLGLPAMARAALNYLRGNPDPARKYECKWALGPLGIPCHVPISPSNKYGFDVVSLGDTDCRMDWQYAHMREMAAVARPDKVERGVRKRILSYLRDDDCAWINPAAYIGQTIDGEWIGTWTTAKVLYSLSETYGRTREAAVKARARKVLLALKKLAQWDGDRAYYMGIAPVRDGKWLMRGWCESHGRNYPFIVEPCLRYWECTGDEEGLKLAKAFTEGFLAGSQPDMRAHRIDPKTGAFQKHVHLHTHAMWGVAHLGAILKEPRYLDYAQKAYDFVVANGTDYGWYPEFIPQPEYRTEVCVVGDMVSIAAWLARGGRPHYWDHVERTVRNQLRRSQFFLTPAFLKLFRRLHKDKPAEQVEQALAELRKLEGGFVAQSAFDDWVGYPGRRMGRAGLAANGIQMMGCCPPEGMRGLWEAWCGTVEQTKDGVFVNLCFTRDHPAAKVTAYEPAAGRLDVLARKAGRYLLRVPAFAAVAEARGSVKLLRAKKPTPIPWGGPAGAYVVCEGVAVGESLSVIWPVPRFTQTFIPTSVPGRKGKLVVHWLGNTVLAVEPRGKYLPMFTEADGQGKPR